MNSFYSESELKTIGFAQCGTNVLISKKCSMYGVSEMVIGNNVRIDDFCILSGKIKMGSYIHISAQTMLFGGSYGIELDDFVTISSRCAIYAESDDYSGICLTNPMVSARYRKTQTGKVILHKHVIIGSGCTILPNITLGEGCSVGAMSFVNKSLPGWGIYIGIPCRKLKNRSKKLLEYENQLLGMTKK